MEGHAARETVVAQGGRLSWKGTAFVKELTEGLSLTDKFVLLMLGEYHRTDEKLAWPSVATLARDCLMTQRGVQQVLARLIKNGFIVRLKGGGRGKLNGYQLVGLDGTKDELETLNTDSVNHRTLKQTVNGRVKNPAQPSNAIRKERVEPVIRTGKGIFNNKSEFSETVQQRNEQERRDGIARARARGLIVSEDGRSCHAPSRPV